MKTLKLANKQTLTKGIDDSKLILRCTTSACYDESLTTSGRMKIVAVLIQTKTADNCTDLVFAWMFVNFMNVQLANLFITLDVVRRKVEQFLKKKLLYMVCDLKSLVVF